MIYAFLSVLYFLCALGMRIAFAFLPWESDVALGIIHLLLGRALQAKFVMASSIIHLERMSCTRSA